MNFLFFCCVGLISVAVISGFLMFWKIFLPRRNIEKQSVKNRLSIIIPARDEAKRIIPLLDSLLSQKGIDFETILVDDGSTDETVSIAASYGVKVIQNNHLENGWIGKTAACWVGVKHASGDWLLFLDADTQLKTPESLTQLTSTYQELGARGILSLQPYHTIKRPYENLSAIFNIIVMVGMSVFTVWGKKLKGAGSFGPCILCNKVDYMKSGGHQGIRKAVMDDLALGEAFRKAGYPVRCYGGKGLINFQMYPEGLRSLWEGWTKSFATASQETHPLVTFLISFWISGAFLTTPFLITASILGSPVWITIATMLYIIFFVQVFIFARRTGKFSTIVIALYPLLFLFFTILFIWSIYLTNVRRTVSWRGRKIKL
ncbi:glycosyltransferase [Oceanobacillus manasiensis]|uniref:glycosyltransferase n=1 Tax=Oceanobacillus manasiensis TaxID=586413 RepID=UPI0005AA5828|nr:glycosyltransferase family 2 protein [Oceanobacillus manasiensis]